jgi:hypothetical protein
MARFWLQSLLHNFICPALRGRGMGQKEIETWAIEMNRIMIYGPKNDGTYVVEFKPAAGEVLAISIPASETRVVRYFQERMPYGLFVPEVPLGIFVRPNLRRCCCTVNPLT